jgi:hypothetical protein
MKNIFKYTFITLADYKKLLFVIVLMSILSVLQALPIISIISFILEKLLYLSIGVLLIYILKITKNENEFFATLEKQPFSTFFLHFLPSAFGIMIGFFILAAFFLSFLIIILKFTGSLFILASPHDILGAISHATFVAKVLIGFYFVYASFFSYVFLGKLGEALSKEDFKSSFLTILSTIVDFRYWINTFNLKYMGIYLVWSILVSVIYSIVSLTYILYIFPLIQTHPNFGIIIIPLLVAITTILTYFTFFSAYFANETTKA